MLVRNIRVGLYSLVQCSPTTCYPSNISFSRKQKSYKYLFKVGILNYSYTIQVILLDLRLFSQFIAGIKNVS